MAYKKYINLKELAENYLNIKYSTARGYRTTHPDRLPPAYKSSGHPVWKVSEVEAWINRRREVV